VRDAPPDAFPFAIVAPDTCSRLPSRSGYAGVDKTKFCPILEDDFNGDSLNSAYWQKESSIGGSNAEDFVWYTDSATNSYVKDGALNIVPSLTSTATDLQFGVNNNTYLDLGQSCTVSTPENCIIASTSNTSITIPPVRSASITTRGKVDMKYGRVEVVAKMPTGDWLWPRISLVPSDDHYGAFPASGLIDVRPRPLARHGTATDLC
jgi:beta-glucanase (GH16 family)